MELNEFKTLLSHIARIDLMPIRPTPLYRLDRLEELWDHNGVYIKRDDMTGLGQGGNKIRSLEYLLADALNKKTDLVIAGGGLQSNLCSLTAAACAKLNISCELILNDNEPSGSQGNILLERLCGASLRFIGPVSFQERNRSMNEIAGKYWERGIRPYVIENGASTGMGALGYASAAVEIAEQMRSMGTGRLTLFCPGGNGGIAAGLIYGNFMIGCPFDIVVVSVEDDTQTLKSHIEQIIREEEIITGLKASSAVSESFILTDEYRGGGWGIDSKESLAMVEEFASSEGLFVEKVYTSKVLVGMKDWIWHKSISGPVCFLHTGGIGSLFAQY